MIDFLRRLFSDEPAPLPREEVSLALAVLMVRVARSDGDYSAPEMGRIDRVLAQRFGLDPWAAGALRAQAESIEAEAPDSVRFTRVIKDGVAIEDRIALVGTLWQVVLADGGRDAMEDRMMRLIVSLLGVTDSESGLARQRVLRQSEVDDAGT